MKKVISLTMPIILGLLFISLSQPAVAKEAQYIGVKKCKMCHMSKKRGNQFGIWSKSKHAQAFATLATDEAKAVAKKAGVAGDPQKAAQCLKCHVTAFDAPATAKAASFDQSEGVGCETCHGPGSLYKSMKVMKALVAGTQDAKAVSFAKAGKETCLQCHNKKSPSYKPFTFEERWKEIAHPMPAQ
ncbi:MAG: cytochrome C554 [Actinobacteria bacterium]|nr:cytochrome C554 [Actinomycetota bacterium]